MVSACSYGKFRHDAYVLQCIVTKSGMGFDDIELGFSQLSGLVENLRRDTDFSDIVEESDIVVFFHSLLIITKFTGKHGSILSHTGRVTVCILILHIDHLSECLNHLSDEHFVFLFLFEECFGPVADVKQCRKSDKRRKEKEHTYSEPDLLIQLFVLDYLNRELIAVVAQ